MAGGQGDVERFGQQRHRGHGARPGSGVLEAVRHHDVVARGQWGKGPLFDIFVGEHDPDCRTGWEPAGQCWEEGRRGAVEGGHADRAPRRLLELPGELPGAGQRGFDIDGGGREGLAGLGQAQDPPLAAGERNAHRRLQQPQLLGDGRRGDPQRVSDRPHAAELAQLAQDLQLPDIHPNNVVQLNRRLRNLSLVFLYAGPHHHWSAGGYRR